MIGLEFHYDSQYRGVEQSGSSSGSMDTKLKSDVAESAVVTELLRRGFRVLKPVGDRLPYDLAIDLNGDFVRIQVKSAWLNHKTNAYGVDVRRTKTNRRRMLRVRYSKEDFDFAILYVEPLHVFYIVPFTVFSTYGSTISLIETDKRQRKPKSVEYRERWELLSNGLPSRQRLEDNLSNSVKLSDKTGSNTEPISDLLLGKV